MEDPELKAMQLAYTAIKDLDIEAQQRVVNWLGSKLSLNTNPTVSVSSTNIGGAGAKESGSVVNGDLHLTNFGHVAELFAHTAPKTDVEKALVVGAYLQETQGLFELTGRLINDELKHLGHGASNITATITQLITRKPNLMIQTRKEGKSQQAQKKYRVTTEGLKLVMEMIKK